ncbi:hypothetical protein AC477_05105 [miscellaneous Crenarchaeota group-1 archaeon SG8-32-1]|uniref:Methyltransferase domain-containing protein n=1 Tax=miscellaneous Crenarchaeota group-1 archaeon SG8-32-1 TaxID=1685124 RepID=A0A0M0BPF7_9ARCH|nr:MAG: hypothetical protein AC477_05105 [miscellaneous Crenarchaeota group-1 archaeon SG8-32-1]
MSTRKKADINVTHVFDPKNIAVLESEDRKTWHNVDEILELIELKQNYIVADLGCGSGYFTIPFSYKVKKIYGIDLQKEMLDFLAKKIQHCNLNNIELLLSKEDKIPLEDQSVDLLITVNTLHEFRTKEKVIGEIQRVIKSGGKAIVIDFMKKNMDFGPPLEIRISKNQAKQLFEERGFKFIKSHELLYHYLIIFQKT